MGVIFFLAGVLVGVGLHYASMIYYINTKEKKKTLPPSTFLGLSMDKAQTGVWRDKEYKGLEHSQE